MQEPSFVSENPYRSPQAEEPNTEQIEHRPRDHSGRYLLGILLLLGMLPASAIAFLATCIGVAINVPVEASGQFALSI